MTEVAFHFNAVDKLAYACRLLRKACSTSAKVIVTGDASQLQTLDADLWTFDPAAFVPHCFADAPENVIQHTPVILAITSEQLPAPLPHHDIMVNLGQTMIKGFETFERVIEIVSLAEDDKALARLRWKHYAERGYPLVRHDLSPKKVAV
jgi:DNA polymerase-3 subunit chi